jgi:hypothetical protein
MQQQTVMTALCIFFEDENFLDKNVTVACTMQVLQYWLRGGTPLSKWLNFLM